VPSYSHASHRSTGITAPAFVNVPLTLMTPSGVESTEISSFCCAGPPSSIAERPADVATHFVPL